MSSIRGKKVDLLIAQVRRETENEDPTAFTGIKDVEFLQYLNDAQDRLQSVITAKHNAVFVKQKEIAAIKDTEVYDIPDDAYMENKLLTVEYSPTLAREDYYHLSPMSLRNRDTTFQGSPVAYIRRDGQILLQPKPQQAGLLRINYVKTVNRLDKRRGLVSVAVLGSSSITTLELDSSSSSPALNVAALTEQDFMCIVDREGRVKMRNIPVDAIDAATGVVTISSGFTFEEGETISAGDYAVAGKDSSTHSELPRMCERYLIAYATWKILKRDSSVDFAEQQSELLAMEEDISNSFADISDDITFVPVLSSWNDWTN